MDDKSKKGVTETIFMRLDRICLFADGYFLMPFVLHSKEERSVFSVLKKRNPYWFDAIPFGKNKVYRLTSSYSFHRKISRIFPSFDQVEIGKRLIWSAHITSEGLDIDFNDRMRDDHFAIQKDALSDIDRAKLVLVCDESMLSIYKHAIPKLLQKRSNRMVVQRFFCDEEAKDSGGEVVVSVDDSNLATQDFYKQYVMPNLLEGGIGIDDENLLHDDERHYPGIDRPVDGHKKAHYDRLSIEKRKYVEGYKFGVEPA